MAIRRRPPYLLFVTVLTALTIVAGLGAPAGAGSFGDFYSVVDTDGEVLYQAPDEHNPIFFKQGGFMPLPVFTTGDGVRTASLVYSGPIGARQWDYVYTDYTGPDLEMPMNELLLQGVYLDVRGCEPDQPFPIVEMHPDHPAAGCWKFRFNRFGEPGPYGQRVLAYPTARDYSGTGYVFSQWKIAGEAGPCVEGDDSRTCTFVISDLEGFHISLVYAVPVFSGFADPVSDTDANVVKAGRTVPLAFRVTDSSGEPIANLESVSVRSVAHACVEEGVRGEELSATATGQSGLQNLGDGHYQYNWKTSKDFSGTCRTLLLDLGDGIDHTAEFQFE